jgi:hypothetical protein
VGDTASPWRRSGVPNLGCMTAPARLDEKGEGVTGLGSRIGWVGPVSRRLARVCWTEPNATM